jgi:hypothetical protein
MYNSDIAVAKEVGLIQSEQVGNPMSAHYGDEASIMHLRAGNPVGHH